MARYQVYILRCSDCSLYTGITTNLERRIKEHNFSGLGARYTRSRRPVRLVYHKKFPDRSAAAKEECRIKRLPRTKKLALIRLRKNMAVKFLECF